MQSTVSKLVQLKIKIPEDQEYKFKSEKEMNWVQMDWNAIFHIKIPEFVIEKQNQENFMEMDWESFQFENIEDYNHQDCDYEYEYDCVNGIYE